MDNLGAQLQQQYLSTEWVPDEQGIPRRTAARVVVLAADGRALLARGHDALQPERSWWFTIGGGLAQGEDSRAGAVRELKEETGIDVPPEALLGPILTREAEFAFSSITVRQDEVFYLLSVERPMSPDDSRWTELERAVVDELAWVTPAALRDSPFARYPVDLADRLEGWAAGWDGECPHLVENDTLFSHSHTPESEAS